MTTRALVGAAIAAALLGSGCWGPLRGTPDHDGGGDDDGGAADAAAVGQADGPGATEDGAAGPDAQPADGGSWDGGRIDIYVAGDLTPKTFADGLSGQTPRDFKIALSTYYAMTSATDPSPALCFDHGAGEVVADLSGDTLVGTCPTAALPTAAYTYGRVRIEWAEYTVSGVLHYQGYPLAGDFTFFRAYSDTTRNGVPIGAGQGVIRFSGTGTEIPVTYPPALASAPGVTIETTNGECWMTFAYSRPLPVVQSDTGAHWARFTWEIFGGFRWTDAAGAGSTAGTWDVNADVVSTETVVVPGVTGYHTTSSID